MTVHIPDVDPTYVNPLHQITTRLEAISKKNLIRNILISGPTGSGKTTFAEQFAAVNARPYFVLECGTVAEAEQLIGQWEVRPNLKDHGGGSYTAFLVSGFLEAIQTPRAVICLNEVNRFQSIKAENALFSLLDHQRRLYVGEIKQTVHVAPGVTFFATINQGAQYTATDIMDYAFLNRWSRFIELGWLDEAAEIGVLMQRTGIDKTQATQLVNLAMNLRGEHPVSLRQLEACAEDILLGADLREAISTTMSGVVEKELLMITAASSYPPGTFDQPAIAAKKTA